MSPASRPDRDPATASGGLGDAGLRRTVQGLAGVAVIGCSPEGRICFWNRGASELLDHADHEVLGAGLGDLMRTSGQRAWVGRVLDPDQPDLPLHTVALPRRDGSPVPCLVHVERVPRCDGAYATYLVINPTTATAPRTTLGSGGQTARQRDQDSLGALATRIAHDFDDLLLGMIGHADLLLAELPPDSPERAHVDEIARVSLRAADLCRQLRSFSGAGISPTDTLDLNDLVRDTAPLASFGLGPVGLCLDLADDVPAVQGDAPQLRQVLLDLITNASEALRDREDARIEVRTRRHDAAADPLHDPVHGAELPALDCAVVEVHDNGPGMSGDALDRAFQPFYTTKVVGRGIGLAAGLGIVRAHGGTIRLCSRPDHGTTVTVILPVRPDAAAPASTVAMARPDHERRHARILLVDDRPDVREVTVAMLRHAAYAVTVADGGVEALDLLEDDPGAFDLVVLDLTMPGLGGLEVLDHIRQWRTDLPVLISSGLADEDTRSSIARAPHCRYLSRPFQLEELIDAASEMLGRAAT